MPTGIYNHKPHTEERKNKISKSLTGKRHTEETKRKISIINSGENHPRWKGENAVKISKHIHVARIKPKPKGCEFCNKEKKLALANIKNHNYTKNPDDYKWLCYSCHKKFDLKCAYCGKKDKDIRLRMVCNECYVDGFNVWKKLFIRLLKVLIIDGNYYGDRSFTHLFKEINKLSGFEEAKE